MGAVGLAERAQEFLNFYMSNLARHFEAEEKPKVIRLHFVSEEVIAA